MTSESENFRRYILLSHAWQMLNGLDEDTKELIRNAERHSKATLKHKYLL